jgi:hypothetical protein
MNQENLRRLNLFLLSDLRSNETGGRYFEWDTNGNACLTTRPSTFTSNGGFSTMPGHMFCLISCGVREEHGSVRIEL